jgi:hypothetical protein
MALSDDPRNHILHMFRMEAHDGRGEYCQSFPEGIRPSNLPLQTGERVYGSYKGIYHFTAQALILSDTPDTTKIEWRRVVRCSTVHGCGAKVSIVRLDNGSEVTVRLSDLATGWSGRISELYHAMIERWAPHASFGEPLMTIDEFFSCATHGDNIAPNLYPHPGLSEMKARLLALAACPEVERLMISVCDREGDEPVSQGIIVVSGAPIDRIEEISLPLQSDGPFEADRSTRNKLGPLLPGLNAYEIVWD